MCDYLKTLLSVVGCCGAGDVVSLAPVWFCEWLGKSGHCGLASFQKHSTRSFHFSEAFLRDSSSGSFWMVECLMLLLLGQGSCSAACAAGGAAVVVRSLTRSLFEASAGVTERYGHRGKLIEEENFQNLSTFFGHGCFDFARQTYFFHAVMSCFGYVFTSTRVP